MEEILNTTTDSHLDEKEEDFSVEFIVEGVSLCLVGILGILGNVAAITVFARQHLQKNFHALMLSLAAFDLMYILASILLFSIPQFSNNYKESAVYYYILPWVLPLAQIGLTGSIYFTMAITVERYVTVCWPFYRASHHWPARAMVIPLVAFSVLYNIPKFFELRTKIPGIENEVYQELNSTWNGTMRPLDEDKYDVTPTMMRLNQYYVKIYLTWMNFVLMGLGPFLLLVILNGLTFKELKVLQARGQVSFGPDSCANRKKDLMLAKVSLAIVFVFIVCHSIKWIPNIYELMQVDYGAVEWPYWVEIFVCISHLMVVFNSSVNFYIYFAKHWRIILGLPNRSTRTRQEYYTREHTQVVVMEPLVTDKSRGSIICKNGRSN